MNTESKDEYSENILEEVRRVKREIAAEYGNDVHRMAEALRKEQAESGRTYVDPPARKKKVV